MPIRIADPFHCLPRFLFPSCENKRYRQQVTYPHGQDVWFPLESPFGFPLVQGCGIKRRGYPHCDIRESPPLGSLWSSFGVPLSLGVVFPWNLPLVNFCVPSLYFRCPFQFCVWCPHPQRFCTGPGPPPHAAPGAFLLAPSRGGRAP